MKGFSFRLEPVLKHRAEKEQKAVLAQSLVQQELTRQEKLLATISEKLNMIRNSAAEGAWAGEFLTRQLYMDYLTIRHEQQSEIVKNASLELEKKRRAVIEARKDKLILEKLKEKLYDKYKAGISKQEEKLADDQSTILTYRKKNGDTGTGNYA